VVLTAPFTVRYPMRHEPDYDWWEYACHEGNTIVPNYVTTSRHERENPPPDVPMWVQAPAEVASALEGSWVGQPRIATIEYDIELEFLRNAEGAVQGRLIGTSLPKEEPVNRSFRNFRLQNRRINFEFPNTQVWNFAGELSEDGRTIEGTASSAQGGVPVTFRKR
jgi:hypothetical protein